MQLEANQDQQTYLLLTSPRCKDVFVVYQTQSTFFAYKTLHCTFDCVFKKYLEHILLNYRGTCVLDSLKD